MLAIPGNHDIPLFDARALLAAVRRLRAFGASSSRCLNATDAGAGVNTTRALAPQERRDVARRRSSASRDACAGPRQLRIVVVHQPLAVLRPRTTDPALHGARRIRWAAAGADLVLGGHIHLPYVLPLHERRPARAPLWAVQAGTAVSSRVRHDAGNSVNLVHLPGPDAAHPRRCAVERWDCDDTTHVFKRVDRLELGMGRR